MVSKGFVYISGNIGCDRNFKVVEGGAQAETVSYPPRWMPGCDNYDTQRVALENITKVLEASGTKLENVVKVNIYLANFDRDFVSMNEIYIQASTHPGPLI